MKNSLLDLIYKEFIPNGYVYNEFVDGKYYKFKNPWVEGAVIHVSDIILFHPDGIDTDLTIYDAILYLKRLVSTRLNTVVEVETIKFFTL